ncbi:hypothetical protein [Flectobacillus roseus]|uniref:Uncharacterized protein n=1 Tax=Flectobacillus roseus TaxID=502259 RepID=A0ABT6Y9S8_9BACT|nr:hypothetical protein [Flectobacillus roseus]MDI9859873.1 hypothetical protein [Flectobacillus roseus]
MEGILNFITGENPNKFSLTLGLVMIVCAIFYPEDKKNQNKLQIVEHNTKIELLNLQIQNLSDEVNKITTKTNEINLELSKVKNRNSKKFLKLKNQFYEIKKKSQLNKILIDSISVKEIELKGNKQRIIELESQAESFGRYSTFLIILGTIFTIVGFYGWVIKPLLQRTQP